MLATNELGQSLIDFYCVQEDTVTNYAPMTHSIIAVRENEATLMVYAPYAKQWQFPGGLIEEGETPRQAVLRELLEETNQVASARLLGVMHWDLGTTQVIHQRGEVYGTLFIGSLSEKREIVLQEGEAGEWRWVLDNEALDFLNPLTKKLVEIVRASAGA